MNPKVLGPGELRRHCDPATLDFESTTDLEPLSGPLGQDRATEALDFGIGVRRAGYNLFVMGPVGAGKFSLAHDAVSRAAASQAMPPDVCYLNNFRDAHKPRALLLPAGNGRALREDMAHLVEDLRTAIPAAMSGDEHRNRIQAIERELEERHETTFGALQEQAKTHGLTLLHTPNGFAFAPVKGEEVLSPEDYEKLPADEKKRIEADVASLQEALQKTLRKVPRWRKEIRDRVKKINQETAASCVDVAIEELRGKYHDHPGVLEYLADVQKDAVEHWMEFRGEQEPAAASGMLGGASDGPSFTRYQVNVLVEHDASGGAPVVYEDNPSYPNLVGRVEHVPQLGALVTDFTLVKAGALHRANGGYLVLDAQKVLMSPFAWEGLKRALRAREIRIESLGQMLSLVSTVALEPEPIALDAKVVLLGDRMLYYLLSYYDPEFQALFKVAVDFDDQMPWSTGNARLFARRLRTVIDREELRHLDRSGVARVLEWGARLAEDAERLSTHLGHLSDLLVESDYFAGLEQAPMVSASHVQRAIDARIDRLDRVRDLMQEQIERGNVFIDTAGEVVGQVNGLSVMSLGEFSFGQPTRISARVRPGESQVLDIEREVELGGPIHSKGVFILTGYISGRYAQDRPLSLSASIVFEQSYGEIEGDSASAAELYALLSAVAQLPVRQGLAVTGSVNQFGQVQPIGGVNEKIEGFFDVCRARGLDGTQGVLIPQANVKHLMLRDDVVEAVRAGRFAIYPVSSVDEGIELLTGVTAGVVDESGLWTDESVNARVEAALQFYSDRMHAFVAGGRLGDGDGVPEDGGGDG